MGRKVEKVMTNRVEGQRLEKIVKIVDVKA